MVLSCTGLVAALIGAATLDNEDTAYSSAMAARALEAGPPSRAVQPVIPRASDGLFYVHASLGSGQARLLVDTGATHVVLSHADAARAKTRPSPDPAQAIVTASGTVEVDWVIIGKLEIQGYVLDDVKAAIPRRDPGLSLLGQNALARFSSVSIDGETMALYH